MHNILLITGGRHGEVVGVTGPERTRGVSWHCPAGNICPRVGVRITCGNNSGTGVRCVLFALNYCLPSTIVCPQLSALNCLP